MADTKLIFLIFIILLGALPIGAAEECKLTPETRAELNEIIGSTIEPQAPLTEVVLSKDISKHLRKSPPQIKKSLERWMSSVQKVGIRETRKIPGFHDEPMRMPERRGQHSVRMNQQYRLFYTVDENGRVIVIEINNHDY